MIHFGCGYDGQIIRIKKLMADHVTNEINGCYVRKHVMLSNSASILPQNAGVAAEPFLPGTSGMKFTQHMLAIA